MLGSAQLPQAQPLQNVLAQRLGMQPGAAQPGAAPMPGQARGTAMPMQGGFRMGMPVQAQPPMMPQGTAMRPQLGLPQPQAQIAAAPPQNALGQRVKGVF